MVCIILLPVILGQRVKSPPSARDLLYEANRRVLEAKTISVTQFRTTEEFPRPSRTRFWISQGGYFRIEHASVVDVGSPTAAWTYDIQRKIYQKRPPIAKEVDWLPRIGFDFFGAPHPILGGPMAVNWHGFSALRIELDGRKAMTKETKLFYFFDTKTRLPLGVSANLGSITQVLIFEDLKLDGPIPKPKFEFRPPADWKEVTAGHGGWR
jgi:hypothetical protein